MTRSRRGTFHTSLTLFVCAMLSAQQGPGAPEDVIAHRVFELINEVRELYGIEKLAWSETLAQRAREQSLRKAVLRFPGHEDPDRGGIAERLNAAGIQWQRCGENMFSERGWDDPVNYAAVFWWYSPGHRDAMMNPDFTQSGIGVTRAEDGTFFITQIFVLPPPAGKRALLRGR